LGCGSPNPFQRGPKKDDDGPSPVGESGTGLSEQVYMEKIFPILERDCTGCHGNPAPDFNRAQSLAVFHKPDESAIMVRPSGGDGHAEIWASGSAELELVRKWIMGEQPPIDTPPTARELFDRDVAPNLQASCVRCHGNPAPTYEVGKTKIVPKDAVNSALYQKAIGVGHRQVWLPTSDKAITMKNWIDNES
jgi:cytochrome c553